ERLGRCFPDVRFLSPPDQAAADALLPGADIVLGPAVRPHNFEGARRLAWIQLTAAGVSGFLFPALIESPVVVTSGRGLHAGALRRPTPRPPRRRGARSGSMTSSHGPIGSCSWHPPRPPPRA